MLPPDSPHAAIVADLSAALAALEQARDQIAQVRGALLATEQPADLATLWRRLVELGFPMTHVGAHVICATRAIGERIGVAPTAPSQLEWLTGVDLGAAREAAVDPMRQRADALLAWLAPYLEGVSPRVRTAVTQAIAGAAEGRAPRALVERLAPETFAQELRRPSGGIVAGIRGLGPSGLRELRAALGVPGDGA